MAFSEIHYLPVVAFYPNRLVNYLLPTEQPQRSIRFQANMVNLTLNDAKGEISKKSSKSISKSIEWLIYGSKFKEVWNEKTGTYFKFKNNFVTLTLPSKQRHTDQQIKRDIFNKWLEWARYNFDMVNYVWKAEAQKNGNIHFHILTDVYIPHKALRDSWNKCCNVLKYVNIFERKHKHNNPNSTDVHSLSKVKNIVAYICKYFQKNENRRPIMGKLWAASRLISSKKPIVVEQSNRVNKYIDFLWSKRGFQMFSGDRFSMLKGNVLEHGKTICEKISTIINKLDFVTFARTPISKEFYKPKKIVEIVEVLAPPKAVFVPKQISLF